MIVEMTFSTQKIKQALETESDLFSPDVSQVACVLTLDVSDVSNKYKDVTVVFRKDKVREAYNEAIAKGSDEVTLFYESPSDADWEARGFVREGAFMVRKKVSS